MSKRNAALALVEQMMAIPGPSGREAQVLAFIRERLRAAGLPAGALRSDRAHQRSPHGGEAGNLIMKLPGRGPAARQARRMLLAHVDTVPICVGCRPVRRGGWIHSADANTGLGADNRSGAAVVLNTALHLLEHKLPHPPLTLLWTVQEEVGLIGARYLARGMLGRPKLAFNFDGGSPAKLTIGATGAYRLTITITGKASHAGVAPQHGISAITVAAHAVSALARDGWLGAVRKGKQRGTANVGFIHAGGPTNVVTPHAELRAEVRSHDKRFRRQMLARVRAAFERAAETVVNDANDRARVKIEHELDYEAYQLKRSEPCVRIAADAVQREGAEPIYQVSGGGLDANWLAQHGIATVTLGAGQQNAHTTDEMLNIDAYERACRIALRLAGGTSKDK